ncbi:hypothetical protein EYF80_056231 [Liparis tanakae]|uniref:Uncharacterized protein n=1 Tax=Liparis tanakae TaxID=230148 RepID=A0A4Z2EXB4_9TELE|nr:hypothetical protein EYF80_056231 [Liparis tanakae]
MYELTSSSCPSSRLSFLILLLLDPKRPFAKSWSLTRLNRRDMEAKQVERLMGPERCRPNLFDGAPVESPAF